MKSHALRIWRSVQCSVGENLIGSKRGQNIQTYQPEPKKTYTYKHHTRETKQKFVYSNTILTSVSSRIQRIIFRIRNTHWNTRVVRGERQIKNQHKNKSKIRQYNFNSTHNDKTRWTNQWEQHTLVNYHRTI